MREPKQQGPGSGGRWASTHDPAVLLDRLSALTVPKLVLDVNGMVAAGFGSRRHVWLLASSERLPQPIRLGKRRLVWPLDELRAWLLAGAPRRSEWNTIRAEALGLDGHAARRNK